MDTKIPMKTPPKSLFNYLKGGVGNDPPSSVSIDLETYSSIDIGDCGVYRYVESPDFEILLFGYAFDDEEAQVLDLTEMLPEEIDEFKEELHALFASGIKVRAYNANFEHTCLSHWLGYNIPLDNWWDTMITAAVCGLPRSLKDVGKVLGMSEEDAKMREGTLLVRYFCMPCKPTKANGGRTRNRRSDAPEKWQKFVEYNRQDVVAERAIWRKIKRLEPSEDEHDVWMLDQAINDRGVRCDRVLAENAVMISERYTADLMTTLKRITRLDNPNSVMQLGGWLEMEKLDKESVAEELKTAVGNRKRVLEIRQEIGKSSIKKYQAMLNYMCMDDRCRGLFQFYGANRTGRWSGRGVQLQNLYRNSMQDLDEARSVVRAGDYEGLEMLYDVPKTLSELIRTAFIPKPGHVFAVADFSAIEARVVAWLANEKWRMDLFASGGDIYCQSASEMFHIPVVKHGVNGEYRQKGKIAELACLKFGQLVQTNQGLIPIQDVTTDMKLWDGEEWVTHEGVIYKGEREVITYDGLTATPDHIVYTEAGECSLREASARGYALVRTGNNGVPIRVSENYIEHHNRSSEGASVHYSPVSEMWKNRLDGVGESDEESERAMQLLPSQETPEMAVQEIDGSETTLYQPERQRLQELRSEGNNVRLSECDGSGSMDDQKSRTTRQSNGNRQDRHERKLCSGESEMGLAQNELRESTSNCSDRMGPSVLALQLSGCDKKAVLRDDKGGNHPGCGTGSVRQEEKLAGNREKAPVYDILNAGPHHRFTVSGKLVHNCGYGGSVGAMINMGALKMGLTEEELPDIVAKWREASPHIVSLWWELDSKIRNSVDLGTHEKFDHGIEAWKTPALLHLKLPSGRCLRYYQPRLEPNRFGNPEVTYQAYDSGKWSRVGSYGSRFLENLTQGIARDCLVEAMKRVAKRYPDIVMHVHDEMIVEVPEAEGEEALKFICDCMGEPIPWAEGLLLRGDGYLTEYYRKD